MSNDDQSDSFWDSKFGIRLGDQKPTEEIGCDTCGNRCMDMDMDPYCAATEVLKTNPYGLTVRNGPEGVPACGTTVKLWVRDTRGEKKATMTIPEIIAACKAIDPTFVAHYYYYEGERCSKLDIDSTVDGRPMQLTVAFDDVDAAHHTTVVEYSLIQALRQLRGYP